VKIRPGELLDGKYAVEKELGSGSMGIVVAATSARPGGRVAVGERVAIKVMLPDIANNAELVQRFMREAVAAVRLRSPHVTRVLDVGHAPVPYLVMELLQGATLTKVIEQEGPLPVARAVDYALQVCDALGEAHAMGIVHRDLKLENLFLEQLPGKPPRIKVLDFGLAKLTAPGNVKLTASRVTMGSPQYMSPEQLRSTADVGPSTDVWSLGVCLFEMLTRFDAVRRAFAPAALLHDPRAAASVRRDAPPGRAARARGDRRSLPREGRGATLEQRRRARDRLAALRRRAGAADDPAVAVAEDAAEEEEQSLAVRRGRGRHAGRPRPRRGRDLRASKMSV
jgi:serine/threonine-protein kinase